MPKFNQSLIKSLQPKLESRFTLYNEDCRDVMRRMPRHSVDSIVTDPPYGLTTSKGASTGFTGMKWDYAVPSVEFWSLALRVAKPGSFLLAFGGCCTFHRLTVAIEDAGWEIADCLMYVFGSGFPKGLNIDECRVETGDTYSYPNGPGGKSCHYSSDKRSNEVRPNPTASNLLGRWPANLIHDGSEEVVSLFPSPRTYVRSADGKNVNSYSKGIGESAGKESLNYGDKGSAARFFYCAKSSKRERGEGNGHPTVKPLALLRYITRLVTPPNGIVFDPFMGSGSEGIAAAEEGFRFIGIDNDTEHGYFDIATRRVTEAYRGK